MPIDPLQILLWFGHFLWPFLRVTGLFLTAPIYGSQMVPPVIKAVMAAALAAALAVWLPGLPAFPLDPLSAIYMGLTQIVYGAMLGMVMQIVISAVACAGEMAGLAMGLSFAELQFRESPGVTPVLYDIMLWAGLLGFMAVGGPVWVFAALAHSFSHGVSLPGFGAWGLLASMGGTLFSSAMGLALPVLAVSLCVNLTVGITTVFAPQMNLLSIGFPLLIMAGLWMMADTLFYAGDVLQHLMTGGMRMMISLILHG